MLDPSEPPQTDSGYPTPRDDPPFSARTESRSNSPEQFPITSTPVRGRKDRPIREHFESFRNDLSIIESTGSDSITTLNNTNHLLEGVKCLVASSKELKSKERQNARLKAENETLRGENESLREENCSLREESRRFEMDQSHPSADVKVNLPVLPRLKLEELNSDSKTFSPAQVKSSDEIKKELLSFIKNQEERTFLETKMEHMLISDSQPSAKVFTATATIQVDTDKMDADVQTDNNDHINVVNANLQIQVDQLHSEIETIEKKNSTLENRLFDYEKLKIQFEEDKQKVIADLEKKLTANQEKIKRSDKKIEELESRLSKNKKELEEVTAENRKMLENLNTHEFELDELKVHTEQLEIKITESDDKTAQLMKRIDDLEANLEEEKHLKDDLTKEMENMKKEHEALIEQLRTKESDALKREATALEQLHVIQAENKNLVKENEYLSQSQQKILDEEINLKNELNVASGNLRNYESQIASIKQELAEEKRLRMNESKRVSVLESENEKLSSNQQNADELLEELKKGRLEVDHLRLRLQEQSKINEDNRLREEEFLEIQQRDKIIREKLEMAEKREAESASKLESLTRSDKEKEIELSVVKREAEEYKSKLESLSTEIMESEKVMLELKRSLEATNHDFEVYKEHATIQYNLEISHRDKMIIEQQNRLAELETYPGQTISVSRRTVEVQTDQEELKPVVSESAPVSIIGDGIDVSDVEPFFASPVPNNALIMEEKIKSVINKMECLVRDEDVENSPKDGNTTSVRYTSETFATIISILKAFLPENNQDSDHSLEETVRLWRSLNEQFNVLVVEMNRKVEETKKCYSAREQKNEESWRNKVLGLEDLAEQRRFLAEEFKQLYELEEQEKKDAIAENHRFEELRQAELIESEKVEVDLRQRLEREQQINQRNAREKLACIDKYEEEVEMLRSALNKMENDQKRKINEIEEELRREKRKRAADKLTSSKMVDSFDIVKDKCVYFQKRNSLRQEALKHIYAKLEAISETVSVDQRYHISDLTKRIQNSGLMRSDDLESSSLQNVSVSGKEDDNRRVLREANQAI